jgi:hypothetical protein
MANLKTFSHFPKLPLETRRRIWQHALSVPDLWVVRDKDHDTKQEYYSDYDDDADEEEGDRWPSNVTPTMTFLGPAHYLLGHSCREARQVMETSYMQFDSVRGGVASPWFTVEETVIFVSDGFDMTTALAGFGVDEVARFKLLGWGETARFYPIPSIKLREHIEVCNKRREGVYVPVVRSLIIGRMKDVEDCYTRLVEGAALQKYLSQFGPTRREGVTGPKHPRPVGYSCFGESWAWLCA